MSKTCTECGHFHPLETNEWHTPTWVDDSMFWSSSSHVPISVYVLMIQIYTALQHGSYWLAAMGIRGALDVIMIEKVGDRRSFKEKVDAFQEAGYLSVRQAFNLNTIIEAGHAAVHRQWAPTTCEIAILLDITNSTIETAFLHEERTRHLEKSMPKRPVRENT